MVKHYGLSPALGVPRRGQHFRIGFSDLEPIWNAEDEKYKVFCRSIHVSKATLYIGYVQLVVSLMFSMFFAYHYVMTVSGRPNLDTWVEQYNSRYLSQLMLAITLQVILVIVMIHGVKSERKSFLMPYIVYAAIAVLTGTAGIVNDLIYLDKSVVHHGEASRAAKSQFLSHLLGTLIQAWCLSVVWRCYGYLGDKKIARQIREQLNTTATAFHYPENLVGAGYNLMPQPPPYAVTREQKFEKGGNGDYMAKEYDRKNDTVLTPSFIPPPIVIGGLKSEKQQAPQFVETPKQPATIPEEAPKDEQK